MTVDSFVIRFKHEYFFSLLSLKMSVIASKSMHNILNKYGIIMTPTPSEPASVFSIITYRSARDNIILNGKKKKKNENIIYNDQMVEVFFFRVLLQQKDLSNNKFDDHRRSNVFIIKKIFHF